MILPSVITRETITALLFDNYPFVLTHSKGEEFTIQVKGKIVKTFTGRILDRCRLSIIINSQEEISLSPVA